MQLLGLLEEAKRTGQLAFSLSASQRTRVGRLKKVGDLMHASLLQLDDMIALFNDY